jgi:multimeric flavodoxin WrbA
MKLFIHDLEQEEYEQLGIQANNGITISNDNPIHPCIGCFGCWIKTPGGCVIRDFYGDMGEYLSKCSEVVIVSRCCYGGFSPFVKNVLDRSISYLHPCFVIKNGEMHHKMRYENDLELTVWFYGENMTAAEEWTARNIVQANAVNLGCNVKKIEFVKQVRELKGKMA